MPRPGQSRIVGDMASQTFEAVLGRESVPLIELAPAVIEALGAGKRPPVKATVNGYTFRTTVAVYGGKSYIGLRKEIREAAGVDLGQLVQVALELDVDPREVELPRPLADALDADPEAKAAFAKLSYTHRKEYAQSVAEAKREETRRRRVERTIESLKGSGGKSDPT